MTLNIGSLSSYRGKVFKTFSGFKGHTSLLQEHNTHSNDWLYTLDRNRVSESQQQGEYDITLIFSRDTKLVCLTQPISMLEKYKSHLQHFCSALNRVLQPYKIFYELEFPTNVSTTKFQLDKQTSSGIERVQKLGFSNIDVLLDEKITNHIKHCLNNNTIKSIMLEILFSNSGQSFDYRKTHVIQANDEYNKVYLLRLRRIHWWKTNYNLARAYLP